MKVTLVNRLKIKKNCPASDIADIESCPMIPSMIVSHTGMSANMKFCIVIGITILISLDLNSFLSKTAVVI